MSATISFENTSFVEHYSNNWRKHISDESESEIILIDNPNKYINKTLITKETGILTAIINGDFTSCKKKNIIIIAKKLPINKLDFKLFIEIFNSLVWS